MTLPWDRAQSDGAHEAWAQLIGPLAPELADHGDSLADQVVARAQVDLPDLVSGPDGWQLLHDALAAGARAMAARLERGDDPATVELPPETLDLLRDSAHRGVPLIPLMRLYRLGYSV